MATAHKKFAFTLEGLPEIGEYFGYEDYRLDQPERGLFYVGIGDRRRVKVPERHHNRGHSNIANVHGVLRRVVKIFDTVDVMNAWEITRIKQIRNAGLTLVNKADGGEGTRGLMPCRNLLTGETQVFRVDEIPDGWVHSSTGMVPCRNVLTGETTNFARDSIPEGWETVGKRLIVARFLDTGEVKRFFPEDIPKGWFAVNSGRATFKNPLTGETGMFKIDQIPEGWVHIFTGMVTCRNIETGENAAFPVDSIPEGWAGVTKGWMAMKNPVTGETGSFLKGMAPAGWVGMNSGNKKQNSNLEKVGQIAVANPNATRAELVELCVAAGINKSTSSVYCNKLGLGKEDPTFAINLGLLKKFVALHNRIPGRNFDFEGVRLGLWCDGLRKKFDRGTLPKNNQVELERISCWRW
jgi:hypothetical protein